MSITSVQIDPKKIKMELLRQGLGRSDLCKLSGISESNFSGMIRRGSVRPTTAFKIAEALNVGVEDIIKTEEE